MDHVKIIETYSQLILFVICKYSQVCILMKLRAEIITKSSQNICVYSSQNMGRAKLFVSFLFAIEVSFLKNNHFQPSQKSLCHKIECLKIDSLKVVTLKYSLFIKAPKIFYERRCLRRLHRIEER